jgi:hypothetical protein
VILDVPEDPLRKVIVGRQLGGIRNQIRIDQKTPRVLNRHSETQENAKTLTDKRRRDSVVIKESDGAENVLV